MAGVRIYCRGKIAAQTPVFGRKAGFTGELGVRSYLVGQLNADWLDEGDDLIQTDRRDILWSSELGKLFEEWGQELVGKVGRAARDPMKKSAWRVFSESVDIDQVLSDRFPNEEQLRIREDSRSMMKLMVENSRLEEILDPEVRASVIDLSLLFGPHLTLDKELQDAAAEGSPLTVVTSVLRTARIAELSSYGRIADKRVQVIEVLERTIESGETDESVYQRLIAEAPWLIDPQWSPITANKSFATLRRELERFS